MEFEAGKEYTTRGGLKARVYAVDGGGRYPAHGSVWGEGSWFVMSWTADGKHRDDRASDPFDLMPPKLTKTKYMFLYADGKAGMSDYPSLYRSGCEVVSTAVVELVEGEFGFELP